MCSSRKLFYLSVPLRTSIETLKVLFFSMTLWRARWFQSVMLDEIETVYTVPFKGDQRNIYVEDYIFILATLRLLVYIGLVKKKKNPPKVDRSRQVQHNGDRSSRKAIILRIRTYFLMALCIRSHFCQSIQAGGKSRKKTIPCTHHRENVAAGFEPGPKIHTRHNPATCLRISMPPPPTSPISCE